MLTTWIVKGLNWLRIGGLIAVAVTGWQKNALYLACAILFTYGADFLWLKVAGAQWEEAKRVLGMKGSYK